MPIFKNSLIETDKISLSDLLSTHHFSAFSNVPSRFNKYHTLFMGQNLEDIGKLSFLLSLISLINFLTSFFPWFILGDETASVRILRGHDGAETFLCSLVSMFLAVITTSQAVSAKYTYVFSEKKIRRLTISALSSGVLALLSVSFYTFRLHREQLVGFLDFGFYLSLLFTLIHFGLSSKIAIKAIELIASHRAQLFSEPYGQEMHTHFLLLELDEATKKHLESLESLERLYAEGHVTREVYHAIKTELQANLRGPFLRQGMTCSLCGAQITIKNPIACYRCKSMFHLMCAKNYVEKHRKCPNCNSVVEDF